jgi:hypothetical protein
LLEHGAFVALALLVIWIALLIPLARGTLKTIQFSVASMFLALMIPFFWLGPEITELTILKVGSFKTNAEQATKYFDEIKTIRSKIEAEEKAISDAVTSFDKDISAARAETARIKEAMSWREFSNAQHDRLVSLGRGISRSPESKVLFDSVVGNPEAKRYGRLIAKALSDAIGVPIDEPLGMSTCVECTGVWVCVNESATAETLAEGKAIRGAFELAGITGAKFCTDPKNQQGTPSMVKVIVGPKE